MSAILTLTQLSRMPAGHYLDWTREIVASTAQAHGQPPPQIDDFGLPGTIANDGPRALACINTGMWIARCPFGAGCGGANNIEPGWPFMCPGCANASVGHRWLLVDWPDADTIERLDALLSARPFSRLRNWHPDLGHTLEQIAEENAAQPWLPVDLRPTPVPAAARPSTPMPTKRRRRTV